VNARDANRLGWERRDLNGFVPFFIALEEDVHFVEFHGFLAVEKLDVLRSQI
jgi:hypothetical protein